MPKRALKDPRALRQTEEKRCWVLGVPRLVWWALRVGWEERTARHQAHSWHQASLGDSSPRHRRKDLSLDEGSAESWASKTQRQGRGSW